MCYSPRRIAIKYTALHSQRLAYVPCGKCEECRAQYKNDWSFRLSAELESLRAQGWLIAFGTLTYNNKNLPHVPRECFEKGVPFRKIQCFSRRDCRTFIDSLRKLLHKHYRFKGLRYFLGAERGEHTRRCHYHFLLAWKPFSAVDSSAISPVLDAETMHRYVCRLWRKGFIYPWLFCGGYDKHGYFHKPFEVLTSAFEAAHYAAKYAVKDLGYQKTLKGIIQKHAAFKDCRYFHLQSRSLGALLLAAPEDQKINYIRNGYSFAGTGRSFKLPRYLVNKILFDIKYEFYDSFGEPYIAQKVALHRNEYINLTTGEVFEKLPLNVKRFIRRRPSLFFCQNKNHIFCQKKFTIYDNYFNLLYNKSFQASLDLPENAIQAIEKLKLLVRDYEKKYLHGKNDTLAVDITCYFGLPYSSCYDTTRRLSLWFQRFRPVEKFTLFKLIPEERYYAIHVIHNLYSRLMSARRDYYELRNYNLELNRINNFFRG